MKVARTNHHRERWWVQRSHPVASHASRGTFQWTNAPICANQNYCAQIESGDKERASFLPARRRSKCPARHKMRLDAKASTEVSWIQRDRSLDSILPERASAATPWSQNTIPKWLDYLGQHAILAWTHKLDLEGRIEFPHERDLAGLPLRVIIVNLSITTQTKFKSFSI